MRCLRAHGCWGEKLILFADLTTKGLSIGSANDKSPPVAYFFPDIKVQPRTRSQAPILSSTNQAWSCHVATALLPTMEQCQTNVSSQHQVCYELSKIQLPTSGWHPIHEASSSQDVIFLFFHSPLCILQVGVRFSSLHGEHSRRHGITRPRRA